MTIQPCMDWIPLFKKIPKFRSRVFHYLYYFRSDVTKIDNIWYRKFLNSVISSFLLSFAFHIETKSNSWFLCEIQHWAKWVKWVIALALFYFGQFHWIWFAWKLDFFWPITYIKGCLPQILLDSFLNTLSYMRLYDN